MADATLPNILDYGKMYELPLPAFVRAQEQVGLANQFQQQYLQQNSETLRQKQLKNLFDEQQNPQLLEHQRLQNIGQVQTNRKSTHEADVLETNKPFEINAKQKEWITKAKKSDLDWLEAEGQRMLSDPRSTPEQRMQGEAIVKSHKEFLKMREEQGILDNRADLDRKSREKVGAGHDAASRYAADKSYQRALEVAKTRGSGGGVSKWNMDFSKLPLERQNAAIEQALVTGINPANGEPLTEMDIMGFNARREANKRELDIRDQLRAKLGVQPTIGPDGKLTLTPIEAPPKRTEGAPATPGLPPGAKQIGTSGGKPVYEINGKQYIGK